MSGRTTVASNFSWAGFAASTALAGLNLLLACAPTIPENSPVNEVYWLDQSWSDAERHWVHHAGQGTATLPLPYKWFVSLEQPSITLGDPGLFTDPEYLQRFGFIPSPVSVRAPVPQKYGYGQTDRSVYIPTLPKYAPEYGDNPDGLPVGFSRMMATDPVTQKSVDRVGFTCAACHTGQLEYKGVSLRIDGAPAMTNLGKFRASLGIALLYTKIIPFRFDRFADRVLGSHSAKEEKQKLKDQLGALIDRGKALKGRPLPKTECPEDPKTMCRVKPTVEGFARLDALTRIGNQVFYTDLERGTDEATAALALENNRPMLAPVNYPHIWSTSWFDWVQYDGSILQPMIRNAGEALGVSALVNLTRPEQGLYKSTVAASEIYELEQLLAGENPMDKPRQFKGLRSPKWPVDILGAIDVKKVKSGRNLYSDMCQKCHLPPPSSSEFWNGDHWTAENDDGERYLKVRMFPASFMGTDPAQANVMATRKVKVPASLEIPPSPGGTLLCYDADTMQGSETEVSFAWGLGVVVEKTVTQWYDDHAVEPALRKKMNGYRPNCLRAEMKYKARPLNGIWATAPFLHNGAVPNLFALLSPAEKRPTKFYLGSRVFDPKAVGYNTKKLKGGFELDTSKRGNSNAGHEFSNRKSASGKTPVGVIGRELSEDERYQLIEFLKSI